MTPGWTRRGVLSFLAGLPAAWNLPRPAATVSRPVRREAQVLAAMIGAPESAARIGRWYLHLEPAEADIALLVTMLDGNDGSASVPSPRPPDLEAMIRRDFARGDTVAIGGWWLARSEARVCALAALLRDG